MNPFGNWVRIHWVLQRTPRAPLICFRDLFVLDPSKAVANHRLSSTNTPSPTAISFSIPHLVQKLLPNKSIL